MKTLSTDLIRIDGNTQSRIAINEDVVSDYVDIIQKAGTEWPFPPIDVFYDGTDYFDADGFHRYLAALRAKRASIPCKIHKGTARDALIFGMTANDRHGLRMTRADKRKCVEWFLDDNSKLTQKAIAESTGVSTSLIKKIIAERNPASISGKPKVKRKTPPKRDGKGHITPSPTNRGVSDPFDEIGDPFNEIPDEVFEDVEVVDTVEEPESEPPKKGTPAKQYDNCYWLKQWEQAIGPMVRLVDKLAGSVGQSKCKSHKAVQSYLNKATEEIEKWMK